VKDAIESTLGKIVDAGKIPGMPASADNLGKVLASGVQYIYTHLPKIVGTGASVFRESAQP